MRAILYVGVFAFIVIAYIDVIMNVYDFFSLVITGDMTDGLQKEVNDTFSGLLLVPIILYVVVFIFKLHSLLPALNLSMATYLITEFSLLILQFGFIKDETSLFEQAFFLIIGLVLMIGARWFICSVFYKYYEGKGA